jgi:magnesium transporter
VLRYLRRFDELPSQTDQLFVVDRDERLLAVLPINKLIVNDPDMMVEAIMQPPAVKLLQHEKADVAASAFERYDLVSAPVVDTHDRLVGRVTVDEVLDFVRQKGEEDLLAQAGSARGGGRLRVGLGVVQEPVGVARHQSGDRFRRVAVDRPLRGSIEKLVALAALMPIVAGIGGNSGNQTITMIVRAAALGQVTIDNARQLIRKEMTVSLVNGLVWGGVMGLVAAVLYRTCRSAS